MSHLYIKTNSEIACNEEAFYASRNFSEGNLALCLLLPTSCHSYMVSSSLFAHHICSCWTQGSERGGSMGFPRAGLVSSEHTAQNKTEAGGSSCATWASGEEGHVCVFRKRFLFTHVSQLKVEFT